MNKSFWGELNLPQGEITQLQYDTCNIWLKQNNQEIWVAHDYIQDSEDKTSSAISSDSELWSRWALNNEEPTFAMQPRMPNMPVVVRPESDFYLLPGAEARIYVLVPVWVRLKLLGKQETKITKIPSVILSKTWFGSHLEGELCYWVSSSAVREQSNLEYQSHLCICPVQIKNVSSDKLLVSKFCLRVEFLTLYLKETHLWSNETTVYYKGPDIISEIAIKNNAPREAADATEITPSLESTERSLTVRTFGTLRNWYDKTSSLVSFNKISSHINGGR